MASYLTDFVARLINDENNDYHTEPQIDDALNVYRTEARYERLTHLDSIASGGTVTYLIFESSHKYWGADTTVYNYNYDALTPSNADERNGRWTFSSEPSEPVMVLGYHYDPYATAADLLEVRIAQLAEKAVNISNTTGAGQQSKSGQQAIENLQALVTKYRAMATSKGASGVKVSTMYRVDQW